MKEVIFLNRSMSQVYIKFISAAGFILSIALCVYGWRIGIFTSQDKLRHFIAGFGIAGATVFMLFQAVQVVVPIIPGGLGCLGGVILFGAWRGFLYNYIGICIGSLLAFLIARHYGQSVLSAFFSEKLIEKYKSWASKKERFTKLFAVAIFMPVAPDDFLCYLAGTTDMRMSTFSVIIFACKPFAIAAYSLGLMAVFGRILAWIGVS